MKILLTGGTGFIGGKVDGLLRRAGHEVINLVRRPGCFSWEIVWDFLSPLPTLPDDVDACIHLAAYVDFGLGIDTSIYDINTLASASLARFCARGGRTLLFASMAGIFGNTGVFSNTSPVAPQNHYAMSKYLAERLIEESACRAHILRIGGVYGLDGPSHLGLNRAINAAFYDGVRPTLFGEGAGRRNYLCVDDAARWIVSLLEAPLTEGECQYRFLGGEETLSIRQWLETITDVLFPGERLQIEPGKDGGDCIVKAARPGFSLYSFRQYLQSLPSRGGAAVDVR